MSASQRRNLKKNEEGDAKKNMQLKATAKGTAPATQPSSTRSNAGKPTYNGEAEKQMTEADKGIDEDSENSSEESGQRESDDRSQDGASDLAEAVINPLPSESNNTRVGISISFCWPHQHDQRQLRQRIYLRGTFARRSAYAQLENFMQDTRGATGM